MGEKRRTGKKGKENEERGGGTRKKKNRGERGMTGVEGSNR